MKECMVNNSMISFIPHSREALSWSLTHDYVPLYPKTMESIIGKVPIDHFMSQTQPHQDLERHIG